MMTDQEKLRMLFQVLPPWYENAKRDLPWRQDTDPYHVWLSEIMLQQTRVEAVRAYYLRFLKKLPTIAALAEADEETLLKLWEGLGYYSRVRNLAKAARTICGTYGGRFPSVYADIRGLAGIGDYTAGAISSICFDQPEPAVDGNVLRVYSRLLGDYAEIDRQAVKRSVTEQLREVYPREAPGVATQALMELGATVCVPNGAPHCDICPARAFCTAAEKELWKELPVRTPKKKRKVVEKTVFVFVCDACAAIRKRPDTGLLAGMWEFPNLDRYMTRQEALDQAASWALAPTELHMETTYRHIFSHIEWHMTAYYISCGRRNSSWIWADEQELDGVYALPSAFAPFRKMLNAKHG